MDALTRALALIAVGLAYVASVAFAVSVASSYRGEATAGARARALRGRRRLGDASRDARRGMSSEDVFRRSSPSSSRSGGAARLTGEDAVLDEAIADAVGSPAGSEGSPAGSEGSPAGSEGSPAGSEGSPAGSEGSPAGSEGSPAGSEGSPAGRSESISQPSGNAAAPTGESTPRDDARLAADRGLAASEFLKRVSETLAAAETHDAQALEVIATSYAAREDLSDIVARVETRLGLAPNSFPGTDASATAARPNVSGSTGRTLRGQLCVGDQASLGANTG
jgi:syndecan 1